MKTKGKLFYVVGPSGAGKDSLIDYARKHTRGAHIKFVQRYITRATNVGGESHLALSVEDFKAKLKTNFFALWWESHGNYYGISTIIDHWMEAGLNVVMNGSRGYSPKAIERYPDMITVLIEVSPDTLRTRMQQRGRENAEEIEKRIQRSQQFQNFWAPQLIHLNNDVPLDISGEKFIELISS